MRPPAPPPAHRTDSFAAPTGPGERLLSRRPGLPGGRAVVGALLVVAAGVGTFVVATGGDDGPSTAYPVLTRAVDPGEALAPGDVEWQPMALAERVAASSFADGADGDGAVGEELDGAVALVPLAPGELLQRSQVTVDPDRSMGTGGQLTIPVPVDRTPAHLRRGERVTVLATYGSGSDATTIVTTATATVLDHGTRAEAIGSSATSRLTVALDDPGAIVATAHAAYVAELTIVRTSPTAPALPETYRREPSPTGAAAASPAGSESSHG